MKNLKTFFTLMFAFIMIISCISCSNEENNNIQNTENNNIQNPNVSARLSGIDIDNFKAEFLEIMLSEEYRTFNFTVNQFTEKMNGEEFTFSTRGEFVNWITENIDKTSFTDVNEAIKLHDDGLIYLSELHTKYNHFYDEVPEWTNDEIIEIFEPELIDPPYPVSQNGCQDGCVDICIMESLGNDHQWATYIAGQTQLEIIYYALLAHHIRDMQINAEYTDCFAAC